MRWVFYFLAERDEKMKLFKSVDEKLAEIGFVKTVECEDFVCYERYCEKFNYIHSVDILHEESGQHIIQSYDMTSRYAVGLTGYETKLFLKKMKKMGWYSGKDVTILDTGRSDETKPV